MFDSIRWTHRMVSWCGYRNNGSWCVVAVVSLLSSQPAARATDLNADPIKYATAPAHNVIEQLRSRLESGQVRPPRDPKMGYLPSLLKALHIPESSQVLVYSKTSLQRHRISPATPRALYFNDDVYLGYCQQGNVIEVSAVDPQLGTVFYTVDQKSPEKIT